MRNAARIVQATKRILQDPKKHRVNTKKELAKLESPIPFRQHFIELCLKTRS